MDNQTSRLLRLPQVQAQVGLSKSQIYKLIEQGEFPRQIKVCQRVSAWLASDVDSWIDQRVLESQFVGLPSNVLHFSGDSK